MDTRRNNILTPLFSLSSSWGVVIGLQSNSYIFMRLLPYSRPVAAAYAFIN